MPRRFLRLEPAKASTIMLCVVAGLTTGHMESSHSNKEKETESVTFGCSLDQIEGRVRLAPASLTTVVVNSGESEVFAMDFGLEIDTTGDGTFQRVQHSTLLSHHRHKMHVVLIGADFTTYVHTHPVVQSFNNTDTIFKVTTPLLPEQKYAVAIDFRIAAQHWVPCTTEAKVPKLAIIDAHVEFEIEAPSLGPSPQLEVLPRLGTEVQTTVISPIPLQNDAAFVNDRAIQRACCTPVPGCTVVTQVVRSATPNSDGCVSLEYFLADRRTGAATRVLNYLNAPAHITLARRSISGGVATDLIHIHGQYGSISSVDEGCMPTMSDNLPVQTSATIWSAVRIDPASDYKVFATFNTSLGLVVGTFSLGGAEFPQEIRSTKAPVCDGHAITAAAATRNVSDPSSWVITHTDMLFLCVVLAVCAAALNGRVMHRIAEQHSHDLLRNSSPSSSLD